MTGLSGRSRGSVCIPISHPLGAQFEYYPGMRKEPKRSPTKSPLSFEIDAQPIEEALTALGGIPLVARAFRSLGLPASMKEHVRVKERVAHSLVFQRLCGPSFKSLSVRLPARVSDQ